MLYRPVSAAMLIVTVILIAIVALPFVKRKRKQVFVEEV
jgi:hypothetical protein